MADLSLDDLFRAAMRLPADEQEVLVSRLAAVRQHGASRLTRDQVIADFEARKAGDRVKSIRSLRDKYAGTTLDALTDEQLRADIRQSSTEWESDLDDRLNAD
jgi:hypothetical protein